MNWLIVHLAFFYEKEWKWLHPVTMTQKGSFDIPIILIDRANTMHEFTEDQ